MKVNSPTADTTRATGWLGARDRRSRRLRTAARILVIYGLLAGGALVFSLPFVWMVGTSLKVDREMFGEKITLLPMRPVPRDRSPYLDERYYRAPRTDRYRRVTEHIRSRLSAMELPVPREVAGKAEAVDILARGVFRKLERILPARVWGRPDAELAERIRQEVTPGLAEEIVAHVFRHLAFGPVRVRSFDLQESDMTAGRTVASFWTIESNVPARLVDRPGAKTLQADLHYDFTPNRRGLIRLRADIALPFSVERLFRIQLFLRPDDSWAVMKFYVEKQGRLYRAERPEYMGNFQWTVVTLQDRGPDDRSTKIKLWIPMVEVDRGPGYESRPDRVRLIVELRRNTWLGAWWAKCQRNYRGALDYVPFWRYTATSVFLVLLNIIGNIFSCSLVAYSFARLNWPGRNFSFGLMLATMMIPPQVTMIPYFLIMKHLGWYNTLKPLWVVSFFGNAFNIFLLRQFMKGIPRDLEDAARIDGCNFLQVYWYVIMPLVKPTLACIAIFTFLGVWNDFIGPLIYLSDQRLYPLSLGLYAFNVQAGANYGMMMAGSLLMTLPVVVIFFFAQKYFIQGVTLTGLKA
ncbi:MAG TPA: carbohydrate ABC transporter permease [Kiritimatiellae bacterium]|nr:carbohydrate ABC transporter permease [Kiritimatiellia bacterium]